MHFEWFESIIVKSNQTEKMMGHKVILFKSQQYFNDFIY